MITTQEKEPETGVTGERAGPSMSPPSKRDGTWHDMTIHVRYHDSRLGIRQQQRFPVPESSRRIMKSQFIHKKMLNVEIRGRVFRTGNCRVEKRQTRHVTRTQFFWAGRQNRLCYYASRKIIAVKHGVCSILGKAKNKSLRGSCPRPHSCLSHEILLLRYKFLYYTECYNSRYFVSWYR